LNIFYAQYQNALVAFFLFISRDFWGRFRGGFMGFVGVKAVEVFIRVFEAALICNVMRNLRREGLSSKR
jgi:hypothetical protein